MNAPARGARIDHLVVAAASLAEGVAWCEATLGVAPGPGGAHALFGTHNRLLRLHSAAHPQAYLEIIAIDTAATPTRAAPLRRWFDLDDPAVRERLQREGPQPIHWVASVPDIDAACAQLRALGMDRGPVIEASRPTPQGLLRWRITVRDDPAVRERLQREGPQPIHWVASVPDIDAACAAWEAQGIDRGRVIEASRSTPLGLLRWRITVRDDGQRLFGGALPTLIQWGDTHPAEGMTDAGLGLQGLTLQHPDADQLRAALTAIGLDDRDGVAVHNGPAGLRVDLTTATGQPMVLNPSTST